MNGDVLWSRAMRALAGISKHGTSVLAFGVVLGLLVPQLANAAQPFMSVTVFVFVLGTLLRVDMRVFTATLRRPAVSVVMPTLVMVATPAAMAAAVHVLDVRPEIGLALVLAVSAPPSSGNAAVARMMGLDGAIPLAVTLLSMALTPITVPLLASVFGGMAISPLALAFRLAILVGSAEGVALLVRKRAGSALTRHGPAVDGVIVVALLVFALATMAGMRARIAGHPALTIECVAVAFACNTLLEITGFLLFPGSFSERVTIGVTLGNRNVGLIWAALGAATPPVTALYFACTQFPIYTLPRLIHILVRWRSSRMAATGSHACCTEIPSDLLAEADLSESTQQDLGLNRPGFSGGSDM